MLSFNEYQKLAARTQNPNLTPREQREHALCGLCAEVGEIHSIHQKAYQGHPISIPNLRKEIGDVLWFVCELCDVYNFDMGMIAEENIIKLQRRYPMGFEADKSLHRAEGDV